MEKIVLIAEDIVSRARFAKIDQMIRNVFLSDRIVLRIFAGPDVHSTVNLARIGADDFSIQIRGQCCGKACFAACGWP